MVNKPTGNNVKFDQWQAAVSCWVIQLDLLVGKQEKMGMVVGRVKYLLEKEEGGGERSAAGGKGGRAKQDTAKASFMFLYFNLFIIDLNFVVFFLLSIRKKNQPNCITFKGTKRTFYRNFGTIKANMKQNF